MHGKKRRCRGKKFFVAYYINKHITTKSLLYTTKAGFFATFFITYTIKNILLTNKATGSNLMIQIADKLLFLLLIECDYQGRYLARLFPDILQCYILWPGILHRTGFIQLRIERIIFCLWRKGYVPML